VPALFSRSQARSQKQTAMPKTDREAKNRARKHEEKRARKKEKAPSAKETAQNFKRMAFLRKSKKCFFFKNALVTILFRFCTMGANAMNGI
jgi:hypothetical protein